MWYMILALVVDLALTFYCIIYGYFPEFLPRGDPTSYRILYIHVPMVWNMYFAFTLALACSILFLAKESRKCDLLSFCAIVLGLIFGVGGIVTGMIWANEVWGSPWSWDPRQTSTLVALLSYTGYLVLRSSIPDRSRARMVSSVYAVAAYVTIPLSYISSVAFKSLHVQLQHQPIGPKGHLLLAFKVITSFLLFLTLLNFYYKKYAKNKE